MLTNSELHYTAIVRH